MRTSASLTVILLVAVSPALGDEKSNDRDPWNGFAVGSWVVQTASFTRGDKSETTREKLTRVAAKMPATIELRRVAEGKKPDVFDGTVSTSWHIPGYDPALDPKCKLLDTSKQELVIQGKKYACEAKKYDLSRGDDKASVTFWHCKDVSIPYREIPGPPRTMAVRPDVLRVDVDFLGKKASHKTSVQVVNLAEERKVGDKKVVCVREEGEIEITEDGETAKGKITIYLSHAVPGQEVETVAEGEIDGVKVRKERRVDAFGVPSGK